ncbi:MAG: replication protein domain protein [Conexibacter sp.]|nr:replication protein domain protein [Conexibacter sp.]
MSKLLIPEPPLQLLPSLAAAIGLNEALVLQQVHYWSRRSKDDGWVQRPLDKWREEDFKFWGLSTVKRTLATLRDLDVIEVEIVPTSEGREARIRVNHAVLEAIESLALGSGQVDPTRSGQGDTTGRVNMTRRTIKGEQRTTTENPPTPRGGNSEVDQVFAAWIEATGKTDRTVLDPKRRRLIVAGLASHGLADLLDTVVGWRHSRHHRGENADKRPYNDLGLLLRNAENIEKFRDMERKARARAATAGLGSSGAAILEACPNGTTDAAAIAAWDAMAIELKQRVPANTYDIWLEPLHAHRLDEKGLVLATSLEGVGWVKDRFATVLANAAQATGQKPVRIVACSGTRH